MRMRDKLILAAALAFFLGVGLYTERSRHCLAVRQALRCRTLPTAIINYGGLGASLRALGLVQPVRNDRNVYPPTPFGRIGLWANTFQKKRLVGEYLYAPNPAWLAEAPTRQLPPESPLDAACFKPGWPLLAVRIAPADLKSAKWGIISNWRGHGREWERPAHIVYYDGAGRAQFETQAGVRLHGGRSRLPGNSRNLRIHFRDIYGAASFPTPPDFQPTPPGAVRRLVVHADWPDCSPFANALAFDVSARIGGIVPAHLPVQLVVNGVPWGRYYLTEHLSPSEWERHVGHNDFLMYIHKGKHEPEATQDLGGFHDLLRAAPAPLTLAMVTNRVDIDNVSRFILAMVYCGNSDGFQGAAVLDHRQTTPRWNWISWDMDHSFWDPYRGDTQRATWQTEGWERAYCPPASPRKALWRQGADVRALLFTRLMDECPDYRRDFLRLVMHALNHRLTPAFLDTRIAVYERLAEADGIKERAFIDDYRQFVRRRPAFLRAELQNLFGVTFANCAVDGTAGHRLLVDGEAEEPGYQGAYLLGEWIDVAIPASDRAAFSHWEIDGETVNAPQVKRRVTGPLVIRAVFKSLEPCPAHP